MANRYWVGGAGNWSSTAKWSTTSGGASGASVPGAADVAIFDANSDVAGVAFTATVDTAFTITTLSISSVDVLVTIGTAGNLTCSTSTTISTASAVQNGVLISGNASLGAITLTSGTLNIDGNTVTATTFTSTANTRIFNFGTTPGTLNLTGNAATVWAFTTAGSSTISNTGTINLTYSGGTGTRTINHSTDVGTTNASFKVSAGTDTVVFTANNSIGALDFTGFSGTWNNVTLTLAGNLIVSTGMTVGAGTNTVTMDTTGTRNITSNGNTLDFPLTLTGAGGSTTLQDALTLGSTRTLTLTRGTLNANNYNVTVGLFDSSGVNPRTITMGSGLWTLSGIGTIWDLASSGMTFNKDTANILLSNTSTSARTFSGGGLTYNKLTIGGTTGTSTTTITGASNEFSELASIKTVAHTITLSASMTVTTWSITGTAGNVVTLNSSVNGTPRILVKSGGGYLTGIDYLSVRDIVGSPISDTWYIGANSTYVTTAPNQGYGLFTTQRATNAVVVLTSIASTTWTVPSDWNSASNTIHLIGGGGGGGGSKTSGTNTVGGGGGGGGGYTKLTNQAIGSGANITYQCGNGGTAGAAGGDGGAGGTTSWNSGAATAGGGGGGSSNAATPSSTGGTAGTGTTFNGGVGGAGSTTTSNTTTGCGGGGGGGSAGVNGAGGNGGNGFSSTTAASIAGGGGGGADGGTAGGNASAATGGTGGNNFSGVGGGTSSTSGAVGGGAGGSVSTATVGGPGVQIFGVGFGGGGGGEDDTNRTNTGGVYGGGGGGAGSAIGPTTNAGSAGSQGAIIITYTPSENKSGFFLMFG